MPDSPGRGSSDEGARYDAELDPTLPHPLKGMRIDGKPARSAPPDRQHAALVTDLVDRAADQAPQGRWTVL